MLLRKFAVVTPVLAAAVWALPLSSPVQAAEAYSAAGQVADLPQPTVRRLTPSQYKNILTDITGGGIAVEGKFEPDVREGGLVEVGNGQASISTTGMERYSAAALLISREILDESRRATLLPCAPASPKHSDDKCAREVLSKIGKFLFRRPLSENELKNRVSVADMAADKLGDFYGGLRLALASMLESPQFLFRREESEPDPNRPGEYRLTAYSKASRLSFFLWDSGPDAELLAAAESGELHKPKGLQNQVDRLLASPRLEAGIRAFFTDIMHFDAFEALSKDATIYPQFTADVVRDAPEQTLRTIVDHLLTHNGDYRDLFVTPNTFLTPILGSIYKVPVPDLADNDSPDRSWQPFKYAENDPRAGILSQISFVALHSHEGRSSPTLRGKALRELFLCQKVPDPPANVDFTLLQDTSNAKLRTARDRLQAHAASPMCAGCHKITDNIGLGMENFDSSGQYRTTENGVPIQPSGVLDGVAFSDVPSLAKAIRNHRAAPSCFVSRMHSYGVGRASTRAEAPFIATLQKEFSADGYRVADLLRTMTLSPDFYRVAPPQLASAETN